MGQQEWDDHSTTDEPLRKRRRSEGYSLASSLVGPKLLFRHSDPLAALVESDASALHQHTELLTTSSTAKLADENVAPFLARHIPDQYGPSGLRPDKPLDQPSMTNSRYCYRHRPDLKCRRQADEPSMDYLQRVCSTSSTVVVRAQSLIS